VDNFVENLWKTCGKLKGTGGGKGCLRNFNAPSQTQNKGKLGMIIKKT